jgi:hypothetical protein
MNDNGVRALACGFGDIAAGIGGLAWDLGEPGALLLSQDETRSATFAIEEGGDAAAVEITAGEASIEATLAPLLASRSTPAPRRSARRAARRLLAARDTSPAGPATRSTEPVPSGSWRSKSRMRRF